MATLFDRHSKLVYSVALRVLRDSAAAEDVLQEIFLLMWRRPESFAPARGSFQGWLAVVSRNRSIDVLRRKRPMDCVDEVSLVSPYNPTLDAEHLIMVDKVRAVMAKLPVDHRRALELAFFDGLTHHEIAEKTGHPLGTVKTRIRTSLRSVGKAFEGADS